jgi:hypothetical protein
MSSLPARRPERILRAACVLALLAVALMSWSLLEPTVVPVMMAMTLGQALGTLSFVAFLAVVYRDLRDEERAKKLAPVADPRTPGPET